MAAEHDYSDLTALYVNCTLKRSPETSNTEGLIDRSRRVMEGAGARTSLIRAVDHDIATGVWPDMTEHGWESDQWPVLYSRIMDADILVLCGPIWLGDNSSVMKRVIERLYACSSLLNERGQYAYYGRVGGALITGNEDGVKHCAMNILYSLQHLGYAIPPQADAGWIGEAAPAPPTWTPAPAAPRTTSPTATPPSCPGTSCTWPPCSNARAASRRSATSAPSGTPAAASTSPTPSTAELVPVPPVLPGPVRRRKPGGATAEGPELHRLARRIRSR